jgi:hypothetical protein
MGGAEQGGGIDRRHVERGQLVGALAGRGLLEEQSLVLRLVGRTLPRVRGFSVVAIFALQTRADSGGSRREFEGSAFSFKTQVAAAQCMTGQLLATESQSSFWWRTQSDQVREQVEANDVSIENKSSLCLCATSQHVG